MMAGQWINPWVVWRHHRLSERALKRDMKEGKAVRGDEWNKLVAYERLHPQLVARDAIQAEKIKASLQDDIRAEHGIEFQDIALLALTVNREPYH